MANGEDLNGPPVTGVLSENPGYIAAQAYLNDPENNEVPEIFSNSYNKGVISYTMKYLGQLGSGSGQDTQVGVFNGSGQIVGYAGLTWTSDGLAVEGEGDISIDLAGTQALRLNRVTEAERDALTPAAGMVVFNTDAATTEQYNGSDWVEFGGGGNSFSDAEFEIYNEADNTKIINIDASSITTATTRTFSVPDYDGEFVTATDAKAEGEVPVVQSDGTVQWQNQLNLGDGAEATPTYSFLTSPGTGMRLLAADQLAFSTNENDQWSINAVGILQAEGTGLIRNNDGTEGGPAYSFKNDTDTGVRRTGADSIALVTGGNDVITASATQQVQFNTYGAGTHTGTEAYFLSADASGNIIETDASAVILWEETVDGLEPVTRQDVLSQAFICKTDATTVTADEESDYTNAGVNVSWNASGYWKNEIIIDSAPFNDGNYQTSLSNPYTVVASSYYGGYQNEEWKLLDGDTGTFFPFADNTSTFDFDLGSGQQKTMYRYRIRGSSYSPANPRGWTIEGSNNGLDWTVIDTRSSQSIASDTWSDLYEIDSPGSYRYYRFRGATSGVGNISMSELDFREGVLATTYNTFEQVVATGGGVEEYALGSLTFTDKDDSVINVSGKANIEYSVNGGVDWSTQADFKTVKDAGGIITGSEIRLRWQLVGDATMKSSSISTPSTMASMYENGLIETQANGNTGFSATASGIVTVRDRILNASGDEGNPTYTFSDDIDTGVYSGGASILAFATAGNKVASFEADGQMILDSYGSGSFTGTEAYKLAVDASGNIIEVPAGSVTKTGFDDPSEAISATFTDGTRLLEIDPFGANPDYTFYVQGTGYTKSSDSITISDVEGAHFIYYDTDGLITEAVNPDDDTIEDIVKNKAFAVFIYWDATNSTGNMVSYETHGHSMSPDTHYYLHQSQGAQWISGSAMTDIDVDASGNDNTSAQFGVSLGVMFDEDISFSQAAVASTVGLPIYYLSGSDSSPNLRRIDNAGYSVSTTGTGRLAYNQNNGGTFQLTEVGSNNYVLCHVFSGNSIDSSERYLAVMGQEEYSTVGDARLGAQDELFNIVFNQGLIAELAPLATLIFQTSTSYSNAVKARIRSTDTGADFVDWRGANVTGGSGTGISNPTFDASVFELYKTGDTSAVVAFDLSGITTASTRSYTAPDYSGNLVISSNTGADGEVMVGRGSSAPEWDSNMTLNESTGQLTLAQYGDGSITGTATKFLAVDIDGNIIEEDAPSGGSTQKYSGMNTSTENSSETTITTQSAWAGALVCDQGKNSSGFSYNATSDYVSSDGVATTVYLDYTMSVRMASGASASDIECCIVQTGTPLTQTISKNTCTDATSRTFSGSHVADIPASQQNWWHGVRNMDGTDNVIVEFASLSVVEIL